MNMYWAFFFPTDLQKLVLIKISLPAFRPSQVYAQMQGKKNEAVEFKCEVVKEKPLIPCKSRDKDKEQVQGKEVE